MKIKKLYCDDCEKITKHVITRDDEGGARILLGIISLGTSEAFNRKWYFCTKCKTKTTNWYD